nr:MAG: hypothetical protein J07AB56_06330 [Candidatus Nanosalinarum sp. J07AB56]
MEEAAVRTTPVAAEAVVQAEETGDQGTTAAVAPIPERMQTTPRKILEGTLGQMAPRLLAHK